MSYFDFGSLQGQVYKELNKYKVRSNDKMYDSLTMTAFNGGKYRVPDERYYKDTQESNSILTFYAMDLQSGIHLFLNEMRTPEFRFFVDVDMTWKAYAPDDMVLSMTRVIQNSLRKFFSKGAGDDLFICAISRAPQKLKDVHFRKGDEIKVYGSVVENKRSGKSVRRLDKETCEQELIFCLEDDVLPGTTHTVSNLYTFEGTGSVKSGVHINFKNLIVSQSQALSMREMILVDLKREMDVFTYDEWCDIIDAAVYLTSGLRMLGSMKLVECTCKADTRSICCKCGGAGKTVEKRAYSIHTVMNGDGVMNARLTDACKSSHVMAVNITSIREYEKKANDDWKKPVGCPTYAVAQRGNA